jgi:hypothetical protein
MTDCAHRLAASRHIRKHVDASTRAWLARHAGGEAQRSSLIRLAKSAIDLHAKGVEAGVLPRTDDERSKPLLVALSALQTIIRNEGALT